MAMQSVLRSMPLTYAPDTLVRRLCAHHGVLGLDPLADQQLAGAIMWIPAGGVYLAAALGLLASWVRAAEEDTTRREMRHAPHEEAAP